MCSTSSTQSDALVCGAFGTLFCSVAVCSLTHYFHPLLLKAGDYSRCGEVVVESAYVKLCSGATQEALSMFNEVRDTAIAHKNDFLSQVCACFLSVCVLPKLSASMFAPLPEHSFESRNSSFRGAKTLNHALEGSCVDKQPRKGQRKGGVA